MLQKLLDLAAEPDSTTRRGLLGAISDMFYNNGRDHIAESEVNLFAEVVARVLKDMREEDRAMYAGIIAGNARTPHAVAMNLAGDTAKVAAPVLQNSPVLSENDLVELATSQTLEHRVAISKRANVTTMVTDVLVDFGELDVMETLLDNATAAISERSFQTMATRSETAASLRGRIGLRADAPQTVLRRLLPFLDPEARAQTQKLLDADNGEINKLVQSVMPAVSHERSERAKRRLEIKALAQRVEHKALPLDGFIDDAVRDANALDLALALSELSLLPEKQTANAVLSTDADPLALICKALEMSPQTYMRAEKLRRHCMKVWGEPSGLIERYAQIDSSQAQRTLRFVKLRADLAPTG